MEPACVYIIKRYPENLVYSDKFLNWVQVGSELERYQRVFISKSMAKRRAVALCDLPYHFVFIDNATWQKNQLTNLDFQIVLCEQILITNHEEVIKPNERKQR